MLSLLVSCGREVLVDIIGEDGNQINQVALKINKKTDIDEVIIPGKYVDGFYNEAKDKKIFNSCGTALEEWKEEYGNKIYMQTGLIEDIPEWRHVDPSTEGKEKLSSGETDEKYNYVLYRNLSAPALYRNAARANANRKININFYGNIKIQSLSWMYSDTKLIFGLFYSGYTSENTTYETNIYDFDSSHSTVYKDGQYYALNYTATLNSAAIAKGNFKLVARSTNGGRLACMDLVFTFTF